MGRNANEIADRRRRAVMLGAMVLLAAGYIGALALRGSLVGHATVDGVVGVLTGLFICAHPAANAIDLLFQTRSSRLSGRGEWADLGWLALNLLVLAIGWAVIVAGATRLAARPQGAL